MLGLLDRQRGIAAHIPVFDTSGRRDGMSERGDVTYDARSDVFTCPGGKEVKQNLRTLTHPREEKPDQDGRPRYRAGKAACHAGEPHCRVPKRDRGTSPLSQTERRLRCLASPCRASPISGSTAHFGLVIIPVRCGFLGGGSL
jgi:hypothetical protein